jgi:ABC-2 type transport system ATP-binding protein
MEYVCETHNLTKRFGDLAALDQVDIQIARPSIVGLLGRNGSGKTTLLHHMMGLLLPTEGFVPQEIRLLDWMTVEQHLEYVACFYPEWDGERQKRLLTELELDPSSVVGALSTGNLQKLAIILAVCHHPQLLVLDEPVSDLDPIVRGKLLEFLLEFLRQDEATILVSSHVLRDVEKIVDRVLCLDRGRVITDAALDELKERYAEWLIVSPDEDLPERFSESFVLEQEISGREARLLVLQNQSDLERFQSAHQVTVTVHALNLEELFPLLMEEQES